MVRVLFRKAGSNTNARRGHLFSTYAQRGRGSQANAYAMRTKGEGGFQMEVRTQKRPVFARVL